MSHTKRGQNTSLTLRLTLTAVFAALAFAAMFVFRFNVSFLTFDLKDAVVTLAGLLLGPVTALTVSLLVCTLEFITIGDTGWYGFLMNFASTAAFSVACSLVYRYKKKLSGALLGLASAVVFMVAVMMALNLVVTPLYQGVSRGDVAAMIPTLLLPFNLVKGVANAALVLILYKPVHQAMQAAKLLPKTPGAAQVTDPSVKKKQLRRSILVSVLGVALLVCAIVVFAVILHGDFALGGKFTWFENLADLFGATS